MSYLAQMAAEKIVREQRIAELQREVENRAREARVAADALAASRRAQRTMMWVCVVCVSAAVVIIVAAAAVAVSAR